MAECKENINKHLSSAQQWLSEAEQAFDKDSDIRGELNLFLAQAELTHAQEVNRSRYWRHRYPALRHSLAISLAVIIAAGGIAASYLWTAERHTASRPLSAEQPVLAPKAGPTELSPLDAPAAPAVMPVAAAPAVSQSADDKSSRTAAAEPAPAKQRTAPAAKPSQDGLLTADEVNKLVRIAGKSLRGQ